MKTDNLIPISYVKKFTPLAVGDVVVNGAVRHEIRQDDFDLDTSWNVEECDDDWSLKSFADRPNTGKQPVDDDVVIDVLFNGSWNEYEKPMHWIFDAKFADDDIRAWKPDYAAMLADYKKTQEPKEQRIGDEHPVKMDPDAYMKNDTDIKAPCNVAIPKPVFTQAMKDAGELPPVGCECEVIGHGDDDDYYKCEIISHRIIDESSNVAIFSINHYDGRPYYYSHCYHHQFRPIDTRIDEEKAADNYWDSMRHGCRVMTFEERVKLAFKAGIDWVGE